MLRNIWGLLLFSQRRAVTESGVISGKQQFTGCVFSDVQLQNMIGKEITISVNFADLKPDVQFN